MTFKCLNCGKEHDLNDLVLHHDDKNIEGFYALCYTCGSSFDIGAEDIVDKSFIDDIPKMDDFFCQTKYEFLNSYPWLTEDEYDATKAYYNWLLRVDGGRY